MGLRLNNTDALQKAYEVFKPESAPSGFDAAISKIKEVAIRIGSLFEAAAHGMGGVKHSIQGFFTFNENISDAHTEIADEMLEIASIFLKVAFENDPSRNLSLLQGKVTRLENLSETVKSAGSYSRVW